MKCSNCGAALTSPAGVSLTVCPFCNTDNSVREQVAKSKEEADLRAEFLRRGAALYQDRQVLSGIISDLFATDRKMMKVLRLAVQDGIAAKVAELLNQSISEQRMKISSMVSYFADDYSVARAATYNGSASWWWLRSPRFVAKSII